MLRLLPAIVVFFAPLARAAFIRLRADYARKSNIWKIKMSIISLCISIFTLFDFFSQKVHAYAVTAIERQLA